MKKHNLYIGKSCFIIFGVTIVAVTLNACNSTPVSRPEQPLAQQAKVLYVVHQYQTTEPVKQTTATKYRAPGVWPGRAPGSTDVAELPDTYTEPPKSNVVILRYQTTVGSGGAYPNVGGGAVVPVGGSCKL